MADETGTTKPNRIAKQKPKAHRNVVSRPLGIATWMRKPSKEKLKDDKARQGRIEDKVRKGSIYGGAACPKCGGDGGKGLLATNCVKCNHCFNPMNGQSLSGSDIPDRLPKDIQQMKSQAANAVIIRQGTKTRCMECDGIYDPAKFDNHKCNYVDAQGMKRNRYDQPMAKSERLARCAYKDCGHRQSAHAFLAFADPNAPQNACLECDHMGDGKGIHTFVGRDAVAVPDRLPEEISTMNIKKSGYERCGDCKHILGNHGMAGGCAECMQSGRSDRHMFAHAGQAEAEPSSTRVWQPPTGSAGSRANRVSRHQILWNLRDKYQGTAQDKTEKSQSTYIAKSKSKCPRCATGDYDRSKREDGLRHTATMKAPSINTLTRWDESGSYRATDGCARVEADGRCQHGHQSWGLRLGLV